MMMFAMAESRLKGINTRIDKSLYQTVKDTAILTEVNVSLIFDEGLRLYLAREHARNPELLVALETMRNARKNKVGV